MEARLIFPRFPTEFKYLTLDVADSGVSAVYCDTGLAIVCGLGCAKRAAGSCGPQPKGLLGRPGRRPRDYPWPLSQKQDIELTTTGAEHYHHLPSVPPVY